MRPVAVTLDAIVISPGPGARLDQGGKPFRWRSGTGAAVLTMGICLVLACSPAPRSAGADSPPPKRSSENGSAARSDRTGPPPGLSGWKEVVSNAGAFRVWLPGNPEISNREIKTPVGNITTTTYQIAHEGHFYNVAFNAYPAIPPEPARTLDGVRDGIVKGVNGTLRSERRLKYREMPGRELEIELSSEGLELRMHVRIFLSGRRLYQVQAAGAADVFAAERVNAFMNSFRFQPEPIAERPRGATR